MNNNERYPKDFQEFLAQFKSEEDCWNYIFETRWPNGFVCPKCNGSNKYWITEQKLIHCSSCGHQASITGGTIFHGTRKPLLLWFHIMWWVVATECIGKQIGRVRFKCIPEASAECLLQFIEEDIEIGSTIITDGWTGYSSLNKSE